MPPPRDTAEKQAFPQEAESVLSSSSSDSEDSSEGGPEKQPEDSEVDDIAGPRVQQRGRRGVAAAAAALDSGSGSGRSSGLGSSRRSSARSGSSRDTGDDLEKGSGAGSGSDDEKTPLMKAGSKKDMKAKAKARASVKLDPKATAKPKQEESMMSKIPWGKTITGIVVTVAVAGVSLGIYSGLCQCTEWTEWSSCLPAVEGGAPCKDGVKHRRRSVIKGVCLGQPLRETAPCWMGPCAEPDYLKAESRLPCNRHSNTWLRNLAKSGYGPTAWSALESCDQVYLCCYPCEDVSTLAVPMTCGGVDIGVRPLMTSEGCVNCFPTLGGNGSGLTGCEQAEPFCQLGKGIVTSSELMCCTAVGPQRTPPWAVPTPAPGAVVPKLDDQHFDRHPDKSAYIGQLHHPETYPVADEEAECQALCWHDPTCLIYTFVSKKSELEAWHDRCVVLEADLAKEIRRTHPRTWLDEPGSSSGVKASMTYSTVLVTVRTSEAQGSDSDGPFHVIICSSPGDCEDGSPIVLTSTSCRTGQNCLKAGFTSEFVGTVPVPHGFRLHRVRFRAFTKDAWTLERVIVDCEGQLGSHHGVVTIGQGHEDFTFSVGCVTMDGVPCFSDCAPGGGEYGWCFTDASKSGSGPCAKACLTEPPAPMGEGDDDEMSSMKRSTLSCAELNWPTASAYNKDRKVCGSSGALPLPGCSGVVTWLQAREFCEGAGARLCTEEELAADEATGTGCELDNRHVWSSTPCSSGAHGGFIVMPGSSMESALGRICSLPDVNTVEARCCADARALVLTFTREHRDSHTLPDRLHTQDIGGLANWVVVAGERHDGHDGFFLQSGMLYDQAPEDSEEVEITLDNVRVSPRGGKISFYFKIDSEAGQDELHFFIDGKEQRSAGFPVSGHIPWTLAEFTFPSVLNVEFHSFRWSYRKDRSDREGEDVACIDEIIVWGVLAHE